MYEELVPGARNAHLVDWGLVMVEKLEQPKIVLNFEFEENGKIYKIKFDSFVFKRDGSLNKKTMDTLNTIGFSGKIEQLNEPGAKVNNTREYSIDVIKDDKYWRVEWVNLPGSIVDKVAAKKSLAGFDFSKVNGELMKNNPNGTITKRPFNHAPGANNDPDEIPF